MDFRTENPGFGFYGTIAGHGFDPDAAWRAALGAVASWWPVAHWHVAKRRARIFLDGSGGRHLADDIAGRAATVEEIESAIRERLPAYRGWL
jgi:hypothetical protein